MKNTDPPYEEEEEEESFRVEEIDDNFRSRGKVAVRKTRALSYIRGNWVDARNFFPPPTRVCESFVSISATSPSLLYPRGRVYSGVGRRFVGHSGGGIKIIRLEGEDYIFNEGNKNGAGWIVDRGGVFVRLSSVYSVARRFEQGGGKQRSKRRSMLQLIG